MNVTIDQISTATEKLQATIDLPHTTPAGEQQATSPKRQRHPNGTTFARFDSSPSGVRSYLESHGVVVTSESKHHDGGTHLYLQACPVVAGCEAHGTDIAVIVGSDGKITYHNRHDRGQGLQWADVRDALEPGFKAWKVNAASLPKTPPAQTAAIQPPPADPATVKTKLQFYTADEFDALDLQVEYHIEGIMAAGPVPTIFAGSFKTLKTSLVMALLIALATGTRFLGKFLTRQCKVAIMSGESGGFALQNLARRIASSIGWSLSAIGDSLHICTGVPNLSAADEMKIVKQFIIDNGIKVMVIDPAYLAMKGLRTDDAGNLFAMGVFLDIVKQIGIETGCTMVLVHHNSRGATRANAGEPAELGDIAWGGFPEWAGQWVLLARREKYNPDSNGEHRLWLTAGGRDGHSTLVGVNVTEGTQADPDGRRWEIEVEDASQARQSAAQSEQERREADKQARGQKMLDQDQDTLKQVLSKLPGGDTKSGIRERTTLKSNRFNAAFASLLSDGTIESAPVQKSNKQKYTGFRLSLGLTRTHHLDSSESG